MDSWNGAYKETKRGSTVDFETVDKFEGGKVYIVMKNYDYTPSDPRMRVEKVLCYKLHVGQQLRFRGPNLGNAEFWAEDGRVVVLSPEVAFMVIGRHLTTGGSGKGK